MSVVAHLSVKRKFQFMLVFLVLIFVGMLGANLQATAPVEQNWQGYLQHVTKRQELLLDIKSAFGYGGGIHNFKNYVLRGAEKYHGRVQNNFDMLFENLQKYRGLEGVTADELSALDDIEAVAKQYASANDLVRTMHAEGKTAQEVDKTVKISDKPALEGFKVLTAKYHEFTEQSTNEVGQTVSSLFVINVVITLIALVIVSLGIVFISGGIIRPIQQLRNVIQRAAESNDLSSRSGLNRGDEVGEISSAFDNMMDKFQYIIRDLAETSNKMANSANDSSSAMHDTSEGVMRQNAETEQVATAINEMTATVEEVARNAEQAASAAEGADSAANEGKVVVQSTISAITELASEVDESAAVIEQLKGESENITNVLDVIKGIAEQTNLLALNAAIEAARAGEQGRGFAVVADEVRTLAQRTQDSTNDIEKMIETLQGGANKAVQVMEKSRARAQDTVGQATEVGSSFDSIANSIGIIREMNTQIATASEEQSAVVDEINRNISSIRDMANGAVSSVGQATEASGGLLTLSQQVHELSVQFRV